MNKEQQVEEKNNNGHKHKDGCCDHEHKHDPIQNVAAEFTEQHFPIIWDEHKTKLKELSKKELAEQMFFSGTAMILNAVQQDHKAMVEQQKGDQSATEIKEK